MENRKICHSSRQEQTRPDRTLLTLAENAAERLYWHCATVGLMIETNRPSVWARLEMKLGDHLARLLLAEAAIRPQAADAASSTEAA